MQFKHVLITGGAGYIGTSLTQLLLQKKLKVTVLDNLSFSGTSLLPFFSSKNFNFIKGDVRNRTDIHHALEGVDSVIHLAAIVGYPACRKDPQNSHDINVNGTKVLVKEVNGRMPIFFASTSSVYGRMPSKVCTEESEVKPLSEYGIQKKKAEEIIKTNKKFVIYRFATAFGVSPRMRLDLMPNDFTYRAVREKSLIVYEKKFMRTFIHVRDMARSFLFAMENFRKMNGQIYNVGDERMNFTKEDICLTIQKKVDYYLHFADIGKDLERRDYWMSFEKLSRLGFHTSISLEKGIEELVKAADVIEIQNNFSNV